MLLIAQVCLKFLDLRQNVDLSDHALAKWPQGLRYKLKLNFKLVCLRVSLRHFHLNLKEEHVGRRHSVFNLEEVLLQTAFEIIYQEATCIPFCFRQVKNFELDESSLSSIDCCVILVLWHILLGWHVLDYGQIFDFRARFPAKDLSHKGAPVFSFRDFCHLNIIPESHLWGRYHRSCSCSSLLLQTSVCSFAFLFRLSDRAQSCLRCRVWAKRARIMTSITVWLILVQI